MRKSEQLPEPSRDTHNQLWMVPYARNPYFSGCEEELQEIAAALASGQNGASGWAISGAGGVGKTQLALEYAYRHREEYRYVFWVLAESRDTLHAMYNDIAELLDLPDKGQQEQRLVVEAVKSWLTQNSDWLLILDHISDLTLMKDFLPVSVSGRFLFTTRSSVTGKLARRVKLKTLDPEDGGRLLLRRSGAPFEQDELALKDYEAARAIARELNGLPLALDIAGAYIAATSCGPSDYLNLLCRESPRSARGHDEQNEEQRGPVAKAVRVACEKVAKANSAAVDFLRLCAFFAPDEIPEMLIIAGAPSLSKSLQKLTTSPAKRNAALTILQKYALIERDPEIQAFAVQREVQAALRTLLTGEEERRWAERAVRVIGSIFPALEVDDREACQRLLPHTRVCVTLIDHWQIELIEGAWMLHHAGWYLHTRGEYAAAQAYEEKALTIYRAVLGDEHPDTAMILNNLAVTYEDRGRLKDAATLHQQALAIRRSTFGENHPQTAASQNNLALVYHHLGKLDDAASLYRQALVIRCQVLGDEHPDVATSMTNLAGVYHDQRKFDEAVSLYQQALPLRRKALGSRHPGTIAILSSLAAVYQSQGKLDDALSWLQQALTAQRRSLGNEHLDIAATLIALASVYQEQGKLDDAAFWLQQALAIQRSLQGNEQPDLARALETLAIAYEEQEQNEKAEFLYCQALAVYRNNPGDKQPDTARCCYNLALLYQDQKRTAEARALLEQALALWQACYGPNHPDITRAREKYEQLLKRQKDTRAKHEQRVQQANGQKQGKFSGFKGIARAIQKVGRREET